MTKTSEPLWIQLFGFMILSVFAVLHLGLPLLPVLGIVLLFGGFKKDSIPKTKTFAKISGWIMLGVGMFITGLFIEEEIRTGNFGDGLIPCGTILSDLYWDNLWFPLVRLLSL